jgi:hypothetical protein
MRRPSHAELAMRIAREGAGPITPPNVVSRPRMHRAEGGHSGLPPRPFDHPPPIPSPKIGQNFARVGTHETVLLVTLHNQRHRVVYVFRRADTDKFIHGPDPAEF